MKRIWLVVLVLLFMGGISYAEHDIFSNLFPPQEQKLPLIIGQPWHNRQLLLINSCRAYILPDAWTIQRYDPRRDECWIIYLGDARLGQQEVVLYGQPLPAGWRLIETNRQKGVQLIKYVGD